MVHIQASLRASSERCADALKNTIGGIRNEAVRLLAAATPDTLRALGIVRTADFGADGAFVYEFTDYATGQIAKRVTVGRMSNLSPTHELHAIVPIENQYLTHADAEGECRVVVLGSGKAWPWCPIAQVLQMTAAWREPQAKRERDARAAEARQRAHEEAMLRDSDGWRFIEAERKIREIRRETRAKGPTMHDDLTLTFDGNDTSFCLDIPGVGRVCLGPAEHHGGGEFRPSPAAIAMLHKLKAVVAGECAITGARAADGKTCHCSDCTSGGSSPTQKVLKEMAARVKELTTSVQGRASREHAASSPGADDAAQRQLASLIKNATVQTKQVGEVARLLHNDLRTILGRVPVRQRYFDE